MSSVSENVDNRHNTLPEDIASNVFPLMPTIYAVQTSVLSKRWRYTWMLFPNLDFDDTHFQPVDLNSSITKLSKFETRNKESFRKFVDHVLNVCKPSNVKLFRLRVSGYVFESVTNWIDIAIWLNISEFDIQVIPRKGPKTVLPLTLFTYSTITKLKLSKTSWECPPSVYLPSMKTLDIIGSINPCDIAFKLICGCPVLESLSLEVLCSNNKEDYVFNIPSLKRLTLKIRSKVSNEVVLNLPNLEYLFVGGVLRLLFIEEDMFLLIWASFAPCERTFNHSLVDILNKIRGVQSLSIPYLAFTSPLPSFPNMKHLELNGFWESKRISQFLESCLVLKHLCVHLIVMGFSAEISWIEPKSVPACMLTNLATIKFTKCCDIEFLQYLLRNTKVLKTVKFTSKRFCIGEEEWLCEQVHKVPWASPHCEIHFRTS